MDAANGRAGGTNRAERAFRTALIGGLRGRCPNCMVGPVFRSWFKVLEECPVCHLTYRPESGYYTGAMYLNYILSLFLIGPVYATTLLLDPRTASLEPWKLALFWGGSAGLISLAPMHFSYGLWLAMDFWLNPWEAGKPPELLSR